MKYLLDVGVLIAAINQDHVHHDKVNAWLKGKPLAVCPLAELGFLRITTQPTAFNLAMADARRFLAAFLNAHQVEFIPDYLPALRSQAPSTKVVTDYYLCELAAHKSGGWKLATLDTKIAHPAAEVI